MMNETLRERINSGFANMAVLHKIFADKLDLVNETWAFLETLWKKKFLIPKCVTFFHVNNFVFLINLKLCQLQDWSYYIFILVLVFLCFLQIYTFMKRKQ